jgi:hypothetical protein
MYSCGYWCGILFWKCQKIVTSLQHFWFTTKYKGSISIDFRRQAKRNFGQQICKCSWDSKNSLSSS